MSSKFEWHSAEETGWEKIPAPERPPRRRFLRLRGLATGLLLLLGLAGLAAWGYRSLNQQVETTGSHLAADVRASHHLVEQAATNEDMELFRALLAEFPHWRRLQVRLLGQGLFYDRPSLNLWRPLSNAAPLTPTITLSPDLQQAEVAQSFPYLTETADGLTATMFLTRTAVYNLSDERWLRAPLPETETFWGDWESAKGRYLSLAFPARDGDVARRLAGDLDEVIHRLCRETAVRCPPGLRFRLRLSREPTSPFTLNQNFRALNTINTISVAIPYMYRMDLPAPTLVGRPGDEAGYQALLRGYAGWVTAVITARLDEQQAASDAFVAAQLARIDLRPPPPPGYRPDYTPAEPPIPLPEQDVLLLCTLDDQAHLWRYDPAADTWIDAQAAAGRLQPFRNTTALWPLPGDEGVLLQTERRVDGAPRTHLIAWQNGEERLLLDAAAAYQTLPAFSPDGRYLLLARPPENGASGRDFRLLDITACQQGDCALHPLAGVPYWSPDGSQSLVMDRSQWPADLYRGDETGQRRAWVDAGWSPFWLNAKTYGYVRPSQATTSFQMGEGVEIVVVPADPDNPYPAAQRVLHSDDLWGALAPTWATEGEPPQIFVNDVLPNPAGSTLMISAVVLPADNVSGRQYFFRYEVQEGELSVLMALDGTSGSPATFTENGRFLTALLTGQSDVILYVYDTLHDEQDTIPLNGGGGHPFPHYDWSADERWLVIADDRMLHLTAPAFAYKRPIFHNLNGCHTAVWINDTETGDRELEIRD